MLTPRRAGPALAALLERLGPPLVSQPGGRLLYALPPQPEASAPQ